ncbi:plastocyanin/azurin family copper-binding protein [Halomonas sp. PR-M31]|uniref:cupredoxin domain-containing protein n=1 Tax=Halomonas sp. PR-M31 TaxID=1471202 RepID=UPI000650783C|nr:plastocyanin/azurin family copper-binding protein [Halomonas sp. PR-M31]
MRQLLLAITLGLTATAALAGAGHDGSEQNISEAEIDRTIEVTAGDLWFKPNDLVIAPGETVKFVIENLGQIEHEFVIGAADAQKEHREMMLDMASGDGRHHDMSAGHHSAGNNVMPAVTVASGETRTLVWTAPDTANNDLIYACNIAGHFEGGMHGELKVKD